MVATGLHLSLVLRYSVDSGTRRTAELTVHLFRVESFDRILLEIGTGAQSSLGAEIKLFLILVLGFNDVGGHESHWSTHRYVHKVLQFHFETQF